MKSKRLSDKYPIVLSVGFLLVALSATWVYAQVTEDPETTAVKENDVEQQREQLYADFANSLSGATLVGNFTITGEEQTNLTIERYELKSVRHVQGDLWLFQARIVYGEHDVTLPLTLPVRWAGDTPVICVDNIGFPGLGTYTARVMFYSDHYAGFWSGKDHGGHLFGLIERGER